MRDQPYHHLRRLALGFSLLAGSIAAKAQTFVTAPLSGANTTGVYYNNTGITLSNGFTANGATGSFHAYVTNAFCAPLNAVPTSNKNYVTSYTTQKAGITSFAALSTCDVMQTIMYYDGLGRPEQSVQVKGSHTLKDVIQPIAYDAYGREEKRYLPYTTPAGTPGSFRTDALTPAAGVFDFYKPAGSGASGTQQSNGIVVIPTPFSQSVFEASPVNRVVEQGAPGDAWQPAGSRTTTGRTVVSEFLTNNNTTWASDTITSRQVVRYNAKINANFSRKLTDSGTYANGTLSVTVIKDENWASGRAGTTEEYKNLQGRVVLKRTYNRNGSTVEKLSTYYVYDDMDNLAFVLPPKANPDAGLTTAANQITLNNLCYQYQYDLRQRMTAKRIPGKGWDEMIYNKLDQVVFTQDSIQRVANKRAFTKYDAMGRVIIAGIEDGHTLPRVTIQAVVDGVGTLWDKQDITGYQGYTNVSPPSNTSTMHPLVVNYYDTYTGILNLPAYTTPSGTSSNVTGLLTASKTVVLNPDGTYGSELWKVFFYDSEGRNTHTYSQHFVGGSQHLNNYDLITTSYDFTDKVIATQRKHYKNVSSAAVLQVTIANSYEYDHMGRKTDTYQRINSADSVLLARAVYNEVGQLLSKKLHSVNKGSSFLQDVSYAYNERGWLKTNTSAKFAMQLKYNDGTKPQYNGNIADQFWGTAANPTLNNYTYTYDKLNRLRSGIASTNNTEKSITYDEVGNITGMERYLINTKVDGLKFSYLNGAAPTNQLLSITDTTSSDQGLKAGTFTYTYDGNGNMVTDNSKSLAVSYNLLNLPAINTKGSLIISYTYDGTGKKLRRTISGGAPTIEYVDGIHYNGTGGIEFIQTEEGRALKSGSNYNYEYNLADHLGNPRLSFDVYGGTANTIQQNDYLPFGLSVQVGSAVSPKNNYLYNKKELQEELGQYDYGARFYDPVIGRWTAVDPLTENDEAQSPYNYVFNNPILLTDPDGRWPGPNFLRDAWSSSKSSFVGHFKSLAQTVSHPVDTYNKMSKGDIGRAALSMTGPGMAANVYKGWYNLGKAVVNGDGKAAGNVVGGESAKIATVLATQAAGAAASKIVGALRSVPISNPVPSSVARVVPVMESTPTTLGAPGAADVFVTAAKDVQGLNATQLADKLSIPQSPTGFNIFEFPTPQGISSPVNRINPFFIGGGKTLGGASEFTIPNGTIPTNATMSTIKP